MTRERLLPYCSCVKDTLQKETAVSFQAKSTLVMLTALVGASGWYGVMMFRLAADAPVSEIGYQPLVLIVVVPLVVIATVGHIFISALNPSEADISDERDREIARWGAVRLDGGDRALLDCSSPPSPGWCWPS